jgi:hypothetical protein
LSHVEFSEPCSITPYEGNFPMDTRSSSLSKDRIPCFKRPLLLYPGFSPPYFSASIPAKLR